MTSRASAISVMSLLLTVAAMAFTTLPGQVNAAALPDLEVTDLWDYPASLGSIAAQGTTLFFICDPEVKECREGAVFIETRKSSIHKAGVRLALLFRGAPADVRSAALDMDLDSDIYIDQDGRVIDAMLDEEILPALLLVSQDGTVLEAVYGGGESLAGNIEKVLWREAPEPPPPEVAKPEEKKSNKWKWILGAAIVVTIGAVIIIID